MSDIKSRSNTLFDTKSIKQYGSFKIVLKIKRCEKQALRLLREDARNDNKR